jgi:hypothetical protein
MSLGRTASISSVSHRLADLDFAGVGTLTQPPFAARLKLEMLHRVGHVNLVTFDVCFRERFVE